jgi:hypothetical protein
VIVKKKKYHTTPGLDKTTKSSNNGIADLHLRNPQTPPPKKEAVEYRRPSGLAPFYATIPPNYANAGHRQKPTSAKTAHPLETLLC